MDLIDGAVILGVVWSILGGAYLYVLHYSKQAMQIEEYRQQNITARANSKPREWWQEVLVNVSNNPEILSQLMPLIGNANLQTVLQNFIQKKV